MCVRKIFGYAKTVRAKRKDARRAKTLQPALPDGLEVVGQRRKLAEVDAPFSRAVEIRAARRLEAIMARDVGILAVLIGRMAAGHDFDRMAAELDEFVEERGE